LARVRNWQDCCAIEKGEHGRHWDTSVFRLGTISFANRQHAAGSPSEKKKCTGIKKMCGIENRRREATKAQPVVVEAKAKY
jgi:hypothetical protein